MNPTTIIALRVMDLRGEFEAQLRSVARLEEQLRKANGVHPHAGVDLANTVRRELTEMLGNNANIRNVLNELATEVQSQVPSQSISAKPHPRDGAGV